VTLPDKDCVDLVGFFAAVATVIGLPVTVAMVFYAARQLSLTRKATSAATVVTLNDSFRECWIAYLNAADDGQRRFNFAELTNALELACATFRDKILYGASRKILEHYLVGVFLIIESNAEARKSLTELLETPETYENIVYFLEGHHKLKVAREKLAKKMSEVSGNANRADN
jgi:hypothetical protein